MRRGGYWIAALAVNVWVGGCALSNLGPATPPQTYDLAAPAHVAKSGRPVAWQLVVSEPAAVRALAGDRIMIKPDPSKIEYFANAVWSDRLPRLLQARLVETLQRSGRFKTAAGGREPVAGDLELATEIRAFQIELDKKRASAHVHLFVKLVDERAGRIAASRQFDARVAAASDQTGAAVEALNAAFHTIAPKIAAWAAGIRYQSTNSRRRSPFRPAGEQPAPDRPHSTALASRN